jgi:Glycogen recognition site of AMP-activated protein kinase
MTESEQHPYVEWIVREARRPVVTDPAVRARLMAAVRAEPIPRRRRLTQVASVARRIIEPRVIRLSPAVSTLVAAGLVGIGVAAGGFVTNRGVQTGGGPLARVASHPPVSDTVVKFVVVAPQASKVTLVGDFNEWSDTNTPMVRVANSAVWTVTLPLTAGRHLYAYLVDGQWVNDPSAPLAPDDGFGHVNSVRIVSRGPSL